MSGNQEGQDVAINYEVTLVQDVKSELEEIDNSDLTEHSVRFEALHAKLQEALSSIAGL